MNDESPRLASRHPCPTTQIAALSAPPVWQIGCGDAGRRYDDLFLAHDVMCCGPGEFGPFEPVAYQRARAHGYSGKAIGAVRAFAKDIRPGDIVLLRSGHDVITFGVVHAEGYRHNPAFDDVYGWDVSHTQRVIWQEQFQGQFATLQQQRGLYAGYKQITPFTRVDDAAIRTPIEAMLRQHSVRPLKDLPTPPPDPLSLQQFGDALFSKGLSFDAVDQVTAALRKHKRLLQWYWSLPRDLCRPTEHEVVAHIILPLLTALGWSEQRLAVDWHKIDLAVFLKTPTNEQNVGLICEAKTLGRGLQAAKQQAEGYVTKWSLNNCERILVTDGCHFYLYAKIGAAWQLSGYMNVFKLRTNHVCPPSTSAVDTLTALTPLGP